LILAVQSRRAPVFAFVPPNKQSVNQPFRIGAATTVNFDEDPSAARRKYRVEPCPPPRCYQNTLIVAFSRITRLSDGFWVIVPDKWWKFCPTGYPRDDDSWVEQNLQVFQQWSLSPWRAELIATPTWRKH
jgi:hypothetical protein